MDEAAINRQAARQAIRVRIVNEGGDAIFRVDVPLEVIDDYVVIPASLHELHDLDDLRLEIADIAQPHATREVPPDEVINRDG